ncbi:MAG: heavy-metal-associated domain-containing protein [Ignavibacteria bacterium]
MKNSNIKVANPKFGIVLVTLIVVISSGCSKYEVSKESQQPQKNEVVNYDTISPKKKDTVKYTETSKEKEINNITNKKSLIEHKMIKIPSAQCDVCKENITKTLKKVKGITSFQVDIDAKLVHVNFDRNIIDIGKIEKAITMAGYDANNRKAEPNAYARLDDCCKKPEDRKKK